MKTIIQIHKEGKYFIAEDLITHVADQGFSEEEAVKNLKKGLEEHYQILTELASPDYKTSFLDISVEKYAVRQELRLGKSRVEIENDTVQIKPAPSEFVARARTFFSQPTVRFVGLMLLAAGLAYVPLALTIGATLTWPLLAAAAGLAGLAIWVWSSRNAIASVMVTRRNVVAFSLIAGVSLLGVVALPLLAEHFLLSAGIALPGFAHLLAVSVAVSGVLAVGALPMVVAKRPGALERVAVFITAVLANIAATPIFKIPTTIAFFASVEAQRVVLMSEDAKGGPLEKRAADEWQQQLDLESQRSLGIRAPRTAMVPGAVEVIRNKDILAMSDAMRANWLNNFENQTALETWTREEKVPQREAVIPTPVSGNFRIFRLFGAGMRCLKCRVNIEDPIFPGQPEGVIPQSWARGVMNPLNPYVLFRTLTKEQFETWLKRAGDKAPLFQKIIQQMMTVSQRWVTPDAIELLRARCAQAILHEKSHFLIVALPAEDIPPEQYEQLSQLTFEKYLEHLFKDDALLLTSAAMKNLYKALFYAAAMPVSEESQKTVEREFGIEMFCDRFCMFLFENYEKQKVLQAALNTNAWPLKNVGELADLNAAIQTGPAAIAEFLQAHKSQRASDNKWVESVYHDLQAAERKHVLVSVFGDRPLVLWEKQFFASFLGLLNRYDGEGTINQYTDKHCNKNKMVEAYEERLQNTALPHLRDSIIEAATSFPGTTMGPAVVAGRTLTGEQPSVAMDKEVAKEVVSESIDNLFGDGNDVATLTSSTSVEKFPLAIIGPTTNVAVLSSVVLPLANPEESPEDLERREADTRTRFAVQKSKQAIKAQPKNVVHQTAEGVAGYNEVVDNTAPVASAAAGLALAGPNAVAQGQAAVTVAGNIAVLGAAGAVANAPLAGDRAQALLPSLLQLTQSPAIPGGIPPHHIRFVTNDPALANALNTLLGLTASQPASPYAGLNQLVTIEVLPQQAGTGLRPFRSTDEHFYGVVAWTKDNVPPVMVQIPGPGQGGVPMSFVGVPQIKLGQLGTGDLADKIRGYNQANQAALAGGQSYPGWLLTPAQAREKDVLGLLGNAYDPAPAAGLVDIRATGLLQAMLRDEQAALLQVQLLLLRDQAARAVQAQIEQQVLALQNLQKLPTLTQTPKDKQSKIGRDEFLEFL